MLVLCSSRKGSDYEYLELQHWVTSLVPHEEVQYFPFQWKAILTLENKHVAWPEMAHGEFSSSSMPSFTGWKLNPVLKVRPELQEIC